MAPCEDPDDRLKDRLMEALRCTFRPDLLNRIDKIVTFRALGRKQRLLTLCLALAALPVFGGDRTTPLIVRGKSQTLRLYGPADGPPAVVASGDGGWIHLGPEVAHFLGEAGYFVVGVDSKAYLSSFTEGSRTLSPADVPGDFRAFTEAARRGRDLRVLLAGVSEGAGLSVLAASEEGLQPSLLGVLGLGLPNVNELGWRWRDQIIYLTHKVPNEPTFKAADYVGRLGNVPLAVIQSTRDEFVPLAEVPALLAAPGNGPRRLWTIDAADHRFSNARPELRQRILEAIEWMQAQTR
jgi:alpha-beta hydrolase superfamily lysophospholipase